MRERDSRSSSGSRHRVSDYVQAVAAARYVASTETTQAALDLLRDRFGEHAIADLPPELSRQILIADREARAFAVAVKRAGLAKRMPSVEAVEAAAPSRFRSRIEVGVVGHFVLQKIDELDLVALAISHDRPVAERVILTDFMNDHTGLEFIWNNYRGRIPVGIINQPDLKTKVTKLERREYPGIELAPGEVYEVVR